MAWTCTCVVEVYWAGSSLLWSIIHLEAETWVFSSTSNHPDRNVSFTSSQNGSGSGASLEKSSMWIVLNVTWNKVNETRNETNFKRAETTQPMPRSAIALIHWTRGGSSCRCRTAELGYSGVHLWVSERREWVASHSQTMHFPNILHLCNTYCTYYKRHFAD